MYFSISRGIAEDEAHVVSLRTTLRNILRDLSRYRVTDHRSYIAILIMCPGAVAGIYYRVGHWIWYYRRALSPLVRLLGWPYILFKRLVEVYSGAAISPRAKIGAGLYINHFGSIIVGDVVIGENCNLSQQVTIGVAGRGDKRGMPIVGDRVYVAAGAKIFGKIYIGSDVAIGANAVVTKSVPDCAVVGGVPASIISTQGSFDFVFYEGMDTDPARLANLAQSQAQLTGAPPRTIS